MRVECTAETRSMRCHRSCNRSFVWEEYLEKSRGDFRMRWVVRMTFVYLIVAIISLSLAKSVNGWKIGTNWARNARRTIATSIVLLSTQSVVMPALAEESIANQLAAIQAGETLANQGRLDTENGAALTRELQLKPYSLIARGEYYCPLPPSILPCPVLFYTIMSCLPCLCSLSPPSPLPLSLPRDHHALPGRH